MIHLDTSFLIRALVRQTPEDRKLREWLRGGSPLGMSVIAWTEFLCGLVEDRQARLALRIIREPVAFAADDASTAAHLFDVAGRRRGSLADCMIAATAIRAGASLATSNPKDYEKLSLADLEIIAAPPP